VDAVLRRKSRLEFSTVAVDADVDSSFRSKEERPNLVFMAKAEDRE